MTYEQALIIAREYAAKGEYKDVLYNGGMLTVSPIGIINRSNPLA